MRHLTVGEMAKLNHISEQTLRLYDKRGLLSPSFRGQNGYRYYDIKQSAVLDIIQYMKSLGISLKEIKHQLENRDLGRIEAALREKQRPGPCSVMLGINVLLALAMVLGAFSGLFSESLFSGFFPLAFFDGLCRGGGRLLAVLSLLVWAAIRVLLALLLLRLWPLLQKPEK